ncbi:MAG: RNA polymerase sigma factor [Saprospiraceae bacterium]|nr:RNA polymerase sigma factor [Saprospiraceae bacterium]
MNHEATSALVRKAKQGDEKALDLLLKSWHKRVYNYAHRYGGRKEFAQEVVQQTFIQVYQKLDQLNDVNRFRPWLYRIAANCCHSEGRTETARAVLVSAADVLPEHPARHDVADLYEKQERHRMVRRLLLEIPAAQRQVIIMKEYEGLKFREIAEALGESENTIKSRLYYGLEAMRKLIIARKMKEEIYNG